MAHDASDTVHVVCRFRPMSESEKSREDGSMMVAQLPDQHSVVFDLATINRQHAEPTRTFTFDRVFSGEDNQQTVYNDAAAPLCEDVMNGFNCTVFAYGQTGSGKTHTMMGIPNTDEEGIIPRLAEGIFDHIAMADESMQFTVKLSYVEIYMEHIHDLLDDSKSNLRIREGSRGVWIEGVTEEYVLSVDEVMDIMRHGDHNRAVASTQMNERSSRSHSVFIMTVGQHDKYTGSKKGSKLVLVDLAGSETVKKTGAAGTVLKEAQHINRSLSALGNVINALTSNASHIPYRDSKLTRLLSDSLGGNSKTVLIITVSPALYNATETMSTLRFGHRAKQIKNRPVANEEKSVGEYRVLLESAVAKVAEQEALIQQLQEELQVLRDGGVVVGSPSSRGTPDDKNDEVVEVSRSRRDSMVMANLELKSRLEFISKDVESKDDALNALQIEVEEKVQELNELQEVLNAREEELSAMTQSMKDSAAKSEMETNKEKEQIRDLQKKLEEADAEQQVYLQRIDHLQQENLELSQMRDVNLSSMESVVGKPVPPPEHLTEAEKRVWELSQAAAIERGLHGGDEDLMEQLRTLKSNYDVLMAALGRKCESYIELQMNMEKREEQLKRAQETLRNGGTEEKLHEYERRLQESNALSQKLYQSGLYWQQRAHRKDALLREREERDRIQMLQAQRHNHAAPEESPRNVLMSSVKHLKPGGTRQHRTSSSARVVAPRLIQGGHKVTATNRGKQGMNRDSMDGFF